MMHPKCSSRLSLHCTPPSHITDKFSKSRPGIQSSRNVVLEVTQESGFRWCRIATIRIYLPRFCFIRGSQWQSMVFSSQCDPFGVLDRLFVLGVVFDHSQTHTGAGASMAFLNKPNPHRANNVSSWRYPRAHKTLTKIAILSFSEYHFSHA